MLDFDVLIDGTRLEKEAGNTIISNIMRSLQGLKASATIEILDAAIEILEECKKEVYCRAKL